jgi:peptidoglycan hydrolase-like protein with peptidoglycan-binding domain
MATWPIEQSGDTGENVRTVQYLLNAHSASLSVDGDFGPATQAAVKAFQKAHGLTQDGIVGNQTWPALIITVQSGSTGDAVKAVQSQVDSRLPKRLAIDGDFGPQTQDAVEGFQNPIGATVDGIVGPQTWNLFANGYLDASNGTEAAENVYAAWLDNDEALAGKWATESALQALFAIPAEPGRTGPEIGVGAGSLTATWSSDTLGELTIRVNNNVGAPFYFATGAKSS